MEKCHFSNRFKLVPKCTFHALLPLLCSSGGFVVLIRVDLPKMRRIWSATPGMISSSFSRSLACSWWIACFVTSISFAICDKDLPPKRFDARISQANQRQEGLTRYKRINWLNSRIGFRRSWSRRSKILEDISAMIFTSSGISSDSNGCPRWSRSS